MSRPITDTLQNDMTDIVPTCLKSYVIRTVLVVTINSTTENALNKIQLMVNINVLHVSALVCHPQGVYQIGILLGNYLF
jgi:hypothetical protein